MGNAFLRWSFLCYIDDRAQWKKQIETKLNKTRIKIENLIDSFGFFFCFLEGKWWRSKISLVSLLFFFCTFKEKRNLTITFIKLDELIGCIFVYLKTKNSYMLITTHYILLFHVLKSERIWSKPQTRFPAKFFSYLNALFSGRWAKIKSNDEDNSRTGMAYGCSVGLCFGDYWFFLIINTIYCGTVIHSVY